MPSYIQIGVPDSVTVVMLVHPKKAGFGSIQGVVVGVAVVRVAKEGVGVVGLILDLYKSNDFVCFSLSKVKMYRIRIVEHKTRGRADVSAIYKIAIVRLAPTCLTELGYDY